jgi:hypothetical protein
MLLHEVQYKLIVCKFMARNGFVYFEGYQHELVSFTATCGFSLPQLSAHPLGGFN